MLISVIISIYNVEQYLKERHRFFYLTNLYLLRNYFSNSFYKENSISHEGIIRNKFFIRKL